MKTTLDRFGDMIFMIKGACRCYLIKKNQETKRNNSGTAEGSYYWRRAKKVDGHGESFLMLSIKNNRYTSALIDREERLSIHEGTQIIVQMF